MRRLCALGCAAIALIAAVPCAWAGPRLIEGGAAAMGLSDDALVDHRGREVRVLSGLLAAPDVVVVGFVYGGCTTFCPPSSYVLKAIDSLAGPGVRIASISIDPLGDTPATLARKAEELGASPRWSWITGSPDDIYGLLDRVGVRFGRLEDHEVVFLVARRGKVVRFSGLPEPGEVLRAIDEVSGP